MTTTAASRDEQLSSAVDAVQGWIDRRQRAMVGHLHACGQSPAQLHVLGLLRESGPATVSHLAALLGTSAPSASAIVDRMVDGGLVMRVRGEEDRRVVTVSLSPEGRDALHRAVGGRREMLERVLGQLDEDELRDTVSVIHRLEEAISAAIAGTPPHPAVPGRHPGGQVPRREAPAS
jgi:DNA-binding MarR family transcriptional regulator